MPPSTAPHDCEEIIDTDPDPWTSIAVVLCALLSRLELNLLGGEGPHWAVASDPGGVKVGILAEAVGAADRV